MDPLTLGLLMGGTSLATGGLNYLGSTQAAGAQAGASQQAGMLGLIAQQQAIQAQQQAQKQAVDSLTNYGAQAQDSLAAQQARAENLGQQYLTQGVGYQQPYMSAGEGATNQLASLFGQGGAYTQQPTLEQLQMDPSYAWRMQQGQQALLNATRAGVGGANVGSGAAGKAFINYGQNAASQEYQNAYDRFMANRAQAVQGLQNLAGTGAGAANVASNLTGQTGNTLAQGAYGTGQNQAQGALTTGQNIGSTYTGTGSNIASLMGTSPYGNALENTAQARASGYVGGTSALGNALTGGVNGMLAYSMLNRMPQGPTGTYQFGGQNVPYYG